jgi:hypothetical protein
MSPDEVFVLVASSAIALVGWGAWYAHPLAVKRFVGTPAASRSLVYATPLVALAILFVVLQTGASHDVRDAPRYIIMYLAMGAAWVGLCVWLIPYLGISVRDDVAERGNRAAAYPVAGAIVGIMLSFAGGNIGDGPGWWVVVFSAALATAALFVLWYTLDAAGDFVEHITVDRDRAAGVRVAGFLVAAGLILGRAVAGDWISAGATVRDFTVTAWPALVLLIVAVIVERLARPTPARPHPSVVAAGGTPALAYVALAALYVAWLGIPE